MMMITAMEDKGTLNKDLTDFGNLAGLFLASFV